MQAQGHIEKLGSGGPGSLMEGLQHHRGTLYLLYTVEQEVELLHTNKKAVLLYLSEQGDRVS